MVGHVGGTPCHVDYPCRGGGGGGGGGVRGDAMALQVLFFFFLFIDLFITKPCFS